MRFFREKQFASLVSQVERGATCFSFAMGI